METLSWSNLNHNVRLALVMTFGNGMGSGVWGYQVLSMYIYVLEQSSNTKVHYSHMSHLDYSAVLF